MDIVFSSGLYVTLAQIGGNARHHWIVEPAPADSDSQQQMEKGRQQCLHGGDALQDAGVWLPMPG
jgi:hypothetical protein